MPNDTTWSTQGGIFEPGDLPLQGGAVLSGARLAWKSYGTLSPARDNVILYPTSYSATHSGQEWLIGPDRILDPTRWFIVTPDMFGNGLSSSPSNDDAYPALVTTADNVAAQRRLLRERFGIERLACVYGFLDGRTAGLPLGGPASRRGSSAPSWSAAARARRRTTGCSCNRCWRRWRRHPSISAVVAFPPSRVRPCAPSHASMPAGR